VYFMFALQLYFFPFIESRAQFPVTSSTAKSWVLEKTFFSLVVIALDGFSAVFPSTHPPKDHPVQENVFISPLAFPFSIV